MVHLDKDIVAEGLILHEEELTGIAAGPGLDCFRKVAYLEE
jgi:hypothetical protein